jgi:hypothetical protein
MLHMLIKKICEHHNIQLRIDVQREQTKKEEREKIVGHFFEEIIF